MNYRIIAILFLGFTFTFHAACQNQANIWYFGKHGGLDFNSGAPVVLENGAIENFEGVSSISNSDGELLFYSDGITVYNRNHNIMMNGTDLLGHPSSTQSGIIIPLPLSANQYIIFTVDFLNSSGSLHYSIINMNANGGLGRVESKNIFLQDNSAEKISAVVHENKQDIWVVIHERNNGKYKSYLVTKDGVSNTVISSDTGPNLGSGVQGYLKFSTNGNLLAMATYHNKKVEVCNFNRQTGKVLFSFEVGFPDATYGVEFSEDSRFLYASVSYDLKQIYQIDLNSRTSTLIASPAMAPGALQLGPDGRIYVARYDRPNVAGKHLGVIHSPQLSGTACNYIDKAIDLGTGSSFMGLPIFIQSYFFDLNIQLETTSACQNLEAMFNAIIDTEIIPEWVEWNFGDPENANNTSNQLSSTHIYKDAGTYNVTFTLSVGGELTTKNTQIEIYPLPYIGLPVNTGFCPGESVSLDAGSGDFSYAWSSGETSHSIVVSSADNYEVTKTSAEGCVSKASTTVSEYSLPTLNLPDTTRFCPGESATIDAGSGSYSYLWNTNKTSHSIIVSSPGTYSVKKTSPEGCSVTDEVQVNEFAVPPLDLGEDQMLCDVEYILISANGFEGYLWQDGSTSNQIHAHTPGIYSVVATTKELCVVSDKVQIYECCEFSLDVPNVFTPNNDGINDELGPVIRGIEKYQMTIANRWGAILFTTNDINQGWDGKFKNKLCNAGIYFIVLDYERCNFNGISKNEKYYGSVTLLW